MTSERQVQLGSLIDSARRVLLAVKAAPGQLSARSSHISIGALLIAMVSIQCGATFAKQLFPLVGVEGTSVLRLGLAAGMLCLAFRPWRTRLSLREAWPLALYGAALAGMNLLFYRAIQTLPLAVAVAIEFIGPLGLAFSQSRRLMDLVWIGMAVLGMTMLLHVFPSAAGPADIVAMLCALAAGGCWAAYIVVGKRVAVMGRQVAVAYGTAAAAVITLPIGLAQSGSQLLSLDILPMALAVALFTSAIPYSLEMVGLDRLPTRVFGVLTSLEPAIAALSGLLILREHLSLIQSLGIAAIIAASIGTVVASQRPSSKLV